jgi:hypothetical protein
LTGPSRLIACSASWFARPLVHTMRPPRLPMHAPRHHLSVLLHCMPAGALEEDEQACLKGGSRAESAALIVSGPWMLTLGASRSAPPGTFQTPGDSLHWNPDARETSVPFVTSMTCSACAGGHSTCGQPSPCHTLGMRSTMCQVKKSFR